MSDDHGHSFPEFGDWAHLINIAFSGISTICSLLLVCMFNRNFEVLYNGLNNLLVLTSVGTLLLGMLRLTITSAAITGKKFSKESCNVILPVIVALITMITGGLAFYYMHIQIVRRRGEAPTRRYLKRYYIVIALLMIFTAAFSAVEFANDGGSVAQSSRDKHHFCKMPVAGEVVFLIPALLEFGMLLAGSLGIVQILCRPQSLARKCKIYLIARALFVVFLTLLRVMVFIYHFTEHKQNTATNVFLSVFAFLAMSFDALMGAILFALFFWMEGGWALLKRMWRRRLRRFKRRVARANRRKMRDTETSARRSQRECEEGVLGGGGAGNYSSRCATYGSAAGALPTPAASSPGHEPLLGEPASTAQANSLVASRSGVLHQQQQCQQQPLSATHRPEWGPVVDEHHRRVAADDDYSEASSSTNDDDASSPTAGATAGEGLIHLSKSARGARHKKAKRRTDLQKDMCVRRNTLSGMLAFISDEIHGTEYVAGDDGTASNYSTSRIDSGPRFDDDNRFAAPPISNSSGTSGTATAGFSDRDHHNSNFA